MGEERAEGAQSTAVTATAQQPGEARMRPFVVDLREPEAVDPALTGGKAASLARAANKAIATLPGVVLTTAFSDAVDAGEKVEGHPAVREAFERAGGGREDVVARSSSVVEDTSESSMAGQFDSVIGIRGYEAFVAAVEKVLASREHAGALDSPIAVLVQPLIEPLFGGVLFGIDPVSGRTDQRVVTAVRGGPEPLVSGEVDGSHYVLTNDAKVVEFEANDGPELDRSTLTRLVALSRQVGRVFGSPQDVEWAIAEDGTLWLLQSRPVTTEERGVPRGPIYGPGPVAETFPEPLTELEIDLWVPPLRDAVREAVLLAGAATKSDTEASEVVITIDGHVAIDLRLAGEIVPKRTVVHRLNPIPAAQRLRGAWRVGRLRSALPRLSERLLDRVDADLEAVPALDDLTSRQLIALLHRGSTILRALHAHEILMGMLTDTGSNRMTGASVALRVLVEARQDGLTDDEILAAQPDRPRTRRSPGRAGARASTGSRRGPHRRRRAQRQRQRHHPRSVALARALDPGAHGSRGLGARRTPDRRGAAHRAEVDPPHDARARRSGCDQPSGRDPGARPVTRSRRRCAASCAIPAVRPRKGRTQSTSRTRWAEGPPPVAGSAAVRSHTTVRIRRKARCWSRRS